MAHPLEMAQRLRVDEVTERPPGRLSNVSQPENGLFLVPKVIEVMAICMTRIGSVGRAESRRLLQIRIDPTLPEPYRVADGRLSTS